MTLPYKTQILRDGHFKFDGREFSAADVVSLLSEHLTPERKAKIDLVLKSRTYSVATVADGLYDIGNISAVMRSAESFGFMPFYILERPDARYKMSDRISRGSEKWLDIHKENDPKKCLTELRTQNYKIYATDLKATHNIEEIDFSQKVAVVFGNEKDGISDYVRDHVDGRFIWPMRGFAQSFNISVAAALCFAHIHRKREEALGASGDLTESDIMVLRAHYYLRTLDSAEKIILRKT